MREGQDGDIGERDQTTSSGFPLWLRDTELEKGRKLQDLNEQSDSLAATFLRSPPQRRWPDIDESLTGDRTTSIFNGSQSKVFPLTKIGEKQSLLILGLVSLKSQLSGLGWASLVPLHRTLHPVEFCSR